MGLGVFRFKAIVRKFLANFHPKNRKKELKRRTRMPLSRERGIRSCLSDANDLPANLQKGAIEITILREDNSRYRDRNGAQNLSIIRKITMGILAKDKSKKHGTNARRLTAAVDPIYREKLLKNFYNAIALLRLRYFLIFYGSTNINAMIQAFN